MVRNLRLDPIRREDDTVGVLDGQFSKIYASGVFENGHVFAGESAEAGFLREGRMERLPGRVVLERQNHLAVGENRIVFIGFLEIGGEEVRDPALAVDDVRGPAEFLDRLEHTAREEDGPLVISSVLTD